MSRSKTYEIDKPLQMVKMATLLKNHIVRNKLYVPIAGKNYVMVEGWQFAGGMLGLFPKVIKVENIGAGKWMAQVEIVNKKDDKVVGAGFAICSKDEDKKKSFDEYAVLSMAQTRAIGKAYRNLIGWVMKLTGYESTPAEEMRGRFATPIADNGKTAPTSEKSGAKLNELKAMLRGKNDTERIADFRKRTGIILKNFNVTDRHAGILVASLLNSETK